MASNYCEEKGAIWKFLDLTVGELQHYLSCRRLSLSGSKLDLAARALIAEEQNVLPVKDVEEKRKELDNNYQGLIDRLRIPFDPLKTNLNEWKLDVCLWPKVHLGSIFHFILKQKAFEVEYVGQYKTRKAFSYFLSGFVHTLYVYHMNNDKAIIRGKVTPSQKFKEPARELWLVCEIGSGDVLGAFCTCTAGQSECCNHVIAALYKIEYANVNGLIYPSCTSVSCQWNCTSTKRGNEIEPCKTKEMELRQHNLENTNPKFTLLSHIKDTFDPRAINNQNNAHQRSHLLHGKILDDFPSSVISTCIPLTSERNYPPPLPQIANSIISEFPNASEDELLEHFYNKLSFNDKQLQELEKATKEQAKSSVWHEQRVGCITGSSMRDVYTKVNSLSKATKPQKVSPLLTKLCKLSSKAGSKNEATKWGIQHEDTARQTFFTNSVKLHKNGKLHTCGLVTNKQFPFIRASPDDMFSCDCCEYSPCTVEYKCPFSIKESSVSDSWQKTDFLEKIGQQIVLKKTHKYYTQIMGQMALKGCKKCYFVIWTPSQLHVTQVDFDPEHWSDVQRNAIIFFKTYMARVLLGIRSLEICPECDKPCLEEDEISGDAAENSVCCESCLLWYHWSCSGVKSKEQVKQDWVCTGCLVLGAE